MICEALPKAWIVALSLFGCAATIRPSNAPTQPQQVSFQVRSQAHGTQEWQPLSAEDIVHSGDHLALTVQTTSPVYLYVARAAADRPFVLLSPKDPAQPTMLQPNQAYLVPDGAEGVELDTQVGEENFYVMASAVKLPLAQVQELTARAPAAELGQSRPRPTSLGNGNRGSQFPPAAAAPYYTAKLLSPGLFAVRFSFQHQQ